MIRAVFPGTFDPIHYGHVDIAHRAARLFEEVVVAVYDRPLKSLLFTPQKRIQLAEDTFKKDVNIRVMGYSGLTVEFCKSIQAQVIVRGLRVFSDFEYEFRMALANHRLAPDIEVIALITQEEHTFLSGSTVREIASLGGNVQSMVPPHVEAALIHRFLELGDEQDLIPTSSLRD
jgi:pantetheine-phosphate adenylyltransferase